MRIASLSKHLSDRRTGAHWLHNLQVCAIDLLLAGSVLIVSLGYAE